MALLEGIKDPVAVGLALLLAVSCCPLLAWAPVGEEIPQERAVAAPLAPTAEGPRTGAAAPTQEGLLGSLGTLRSGGGGFGAGVSGNTGYDYSGTPPAVGGTEVDLVGTLFNGNAQAFTQAVLASGTSSAAIAISGMLQLPANTIRTLQEVLAGPEPGASAVARAVIGGWELAICQTPELAQDATAMALTGGGPLGAAAARGIARAALNCCSKVAGHLAGASQSLEANPDFVGDLEAALQAAGSQLPTCAIPSQLMG